MREFTKEEFDTISSKKWRCNKRAGESFSLTNTRYVKHATGRLPGTWIKVDSSIWFDLEITPAEEPNALHFHISGMVPMLGPDGCHVELRDILDITLTYDSERVRREFNSDGTIYAREITELEVLLERFFLMADNAICGYTWLLLYIRQGYRFVGNKAVEDLRTDVLKLPIENFLK